MYTVVLMAALSTGADVPDFGRRHGCHGGRSACGCSGGYGGCSGGYGGCSGGYGGWGGCSGSYAGYGGCHGGYGGMAYGGCSGGMASGGMAYGGCSGGMAYGGMGYGSTPYAAPYSGGYYSGTYYGQPGMMPGSAVPQAVPQRTVPGRGTGGTEEETLPPDRVRGPTPATIVVSLPANAVLTFDGVPTQTSSTRRVFQSPPLQPGENYYYTLTAEIQRDGRPVSVSRRVNVRAGQTAQVSLSFPTAEATASR